MGKWLQSTEHLVHRGMGPAGPRGIEARRQHALGYKPVANTNTEFAQFLQEDLKRWTRIARENDIRLD